jgi:epoxyqueuosine reductase
VTDAAAVKSSAAELGFDLAAFTTVEPPAEDRDFFLAWCRDGHAADMAWLSRDPARRAVPRNLLPEALTVVTLGVSYFQGPLPEAPMAPAGRVARYAWGEDYHDVIEKRLAAFAERLRVLLGADLRVRSALDAQPLLERAFARRAGLGFAGKNTNLIAPRAGSWIFLTELLIDRALPPDAPVAQGCGECTQCQTACPTDALRTPYRLDARACIAYHTIENRGAIPREIRAKLGPWLFGCDDCQDACPYNARAKETLWPEFRAERGTGPWVPLEDVLVLDTPEKFRARFRGTPLLRAKRAGLVRNACLLAGGGLRPVSARLHERLVERLRHDVEPVVRGHAAWALGRQRSFGPLEAALSAETDATVLGEVRDALAEARDGAAA